MCGFITCLQCLFLDRGAGTNLFLSYSLVDTGREICWMSTCSNLSMMLPRHVRRETSK